MRFEITGFVKRVLAEGWPAGLPEAARPVQDGRLRFDSLRVEAAGDAAGGHRIVLAFHGRAVATCMTGEFSPGMTLDLQGIEASMDMRGDVP